MPGLARPPSTSCSASTTRVLPAPVSPVSAVMPGPKISVRSSITPRSRTCRSVNTAGSRRPGRRAAGSAGCRRRSGARCAPPHGAFGHRAGDSGPRLEPSDLQAVDDEDARPVGRDLNGDLLVLGRTRLRSSEKWGATGVTTMARSVGPGSGRRPRGCRRSSRSVWPR